jgi:hypothetical protein
MPERRYNADMPLGAQVRRKVDELKRIDSAAREHFELVRERQLAEHPPRGGVGHTPAQKANATQMANKAVAIAFLNWP